MWQHLLVSILAIFLMAGTVGADVTRAPFGKTPDGTEVEQFTIKTKNGMSVKLITLGATITEINVPDKNGKFANVNLGFDDPAGYLSDRNQYFGCTTGRVAGQISNAKFTLDGKEYKLAANYGPNHLHGGVKRSLEKVVWKASVLENPPDSKDSAGAVSFSYTSPDGEEGYPGTLTMTVVFIFNDKGELTIKYEARTDKATPVNLTNHAYFNLAGAGADTILDHELTIYSDKYVAADDALLPTGTIEPLKGTIFDFSTPTRIGARIDKLYGKGANGYNLYYVLKPSKEPALAAKVRDPSSGRVMTCLTTEQGVLFYTGNSLFGQKGKDGKIYKQRSAICLESLAFPNAVNQPTFPSIILRPADVYRQTCIYKFSTE